ncbi:MAG TPA: D-alanyl-D-alanine carboxypeptidase/D-alanyl-D-alanine-endopeptidase [Isosphaeraceae bacterium]|nr:D-alanyl-D-alanine carboxypeptidase/D-alanyl-D-alanine-endopeptidase [Isosphaeraceae bacterium]
MSARTWRVAMASILAVAAGTARGAESVEERVEAVLKAEGYRHGGWGILVVEKGTGEVVYKRDADRMFAPASVTKLFTTAAALDDLGADYRFRTPVHRRGEVESDGTLDGDLILVASGDLCLGGRTGPDGGLVFADNDHTYSDGNSNAALAGADPLAGLDHLAREVRGSGITAVSGDVLIDDRLFRPAESSGSGPSRVSPIVVNDNLVDVVVTPAAVAGEPATVSTVPSTAFVAMDARVETVEGEREPRLHVRAEGPRRFSVRGRIPVGHKAIVKAYEVEEPASFARALFIEALRRRGVRVVASPLGTNRGEHLPDRDAVAKLPKVAEYTSPPFKEYVRVVLKVSHNLYASTLPLLVAAHHDESTLADGLRREGAFLRSAGIDIDTISFGGGAGGSRADLVTPRATVALLRAMARRPDFAAFEAALPVLGRDGTLAKAVGPDSPARGHVRAKTGTYYVENSLNGKGVLTSKALAGYIETASGRSLVFAAFLNNVPLDGSGDGPGTPAAAGRLLGRLCETLYDDKDDGAKAGD